MEIGKKNPKWVDQMGKIWPNLTAEDNINEVPLTWSVSPRKNWMMKIKNFQCKVFKCKPQQIYHDLIIKRNL